MFVPFFSLTEINIWFSCCLQATHACATETFQGERDKEGDEGMLGQITDKNGIRRKKVYQGITQEGTRRKMYGGSKGKKGGNQRIKVRIKRDTKNGENEAGVEEGVGTDVDGGSGDPSNGRHTHQAVTFTGQAAPNDKNLCTLSLCIIGLVQSECIRAHGRARKCVCVCMCCRVRYESRV